MDGNLVLISSGVFLLLLNTVGQGLALYKVNKVEGILVGHDDAIKNNSRRICRLEEHHME